MSQNIDMKNIIEDGFAQYSGAVLQSRALVDVRDCIKPSARQIFYCMYTDKFTADKPFKKTLKAIGSAMRLYIHGDSSCEGVIMRAGQPFSMRYPLVEVEGSYGNQMESGNWAAPRYSSARLAPIANNLFTDIEKNTIDDWRDNYDDTEKYPTVLSTKGFYNLVNGTMGIAVGAAASIPQFNLNDLNKALITLISNPNATFDEIYCAPDFATGGIIINKNEVKESLKNGKGKACIIRGKVVYDKNKHTLTVTELPYSVYTNTICQELEKIANSDNNPGIERINDLTGETPCIRIYLEKTANAEVVEKFLYKNTSIQSSYGINMTMLDEGKYPKVFTWKEVLLAHLAHEKVVYKKGFEFDLKKIEHRLKIIDGIIKAIAHIEEVIKIIKSSSSTIEANKNLCSFLIIDEEQAKAILDIKLARLARLEIEKYENEKQELLNKKDTINKILNSEELFNNEIIKGFQETAKKYGDSRRTEIAQIEMPKEDKEIETVVPENCVVVLSSAGDIKRVPTSNFKVQARNGKGAKTEDDSILSMISTNTVDALMLFSSTGKLYRIIVNDVPEGNNTSKGINVNQLIKTAPNEKIVAMTSLFRKSSAKYVIFITKNGILKKTALTEYEGAKRCNSGIAALKLKEGDELVHVTFAEEEEFIIITKFGQSIRIETKDIAPIGRITMGIKAIKLNEGDEVVTGLPIKHKTDTLATFTADGLAKKTSLDEFPVQLKNGKGLKVSAKESTIVGACLISDEDYILIIGKSKGICISAKDIPLSGRTTIGSSMIKDNIIQKAIKIKKES